MAAAATSEYRRDELAIALAMRRGEQPGTVRIEVG
jgi:hypothetical protein